MIALKISNIKIFMEKLLTSEVFDHFQVEEVTIETFNTFSIDGHINKDFFAGSEDETSNNNNRSFSLWSELRPICLSLIKGKRTPISFKFILHADDATKETVISKSESDLAPFSLTLGVNIKFTNNELILTTGTAYNVFTLDKSAEKAWDNYFPSFLESCGIDNQLL